MNEFIVNDMQIAATNGMLPKGALTKYQEQQRWSFIYVNEIFLHHLSEMKVASTCLRLFCGCSECECLFLLNISYNGFFSGSNVKDERDHKYNKQKYLF